eukprot:GHRR01008402.1.p1 GENE.GHRR01008402.1~~GHRR01008402.1.p1  ORF type:complete len:124 (+),score=16.02 GHRR01008402.1:608-979(+)
MLNLGLPRASHQTVAAAVAVTGCLWTPSCNSWLPDQLHTPHRAISQQSAAATLLLWHLAAWFCTCIDCLQCLTGWCVSTPCTANGHLRPSYPTVTAYFCSMYPIIPIHLSIVYLLFTLWPSLL